MEGETEGKNSKHKNEKSILVQKMGNRQKLHGAERERYELLQCIAYGFVPS